MSAGVLNDRWQFGWRRLGVEPPARLFEAIVVRYSEPHRRYHTLQHLEECFARLDEFGGQVPHPAEVELALWFHDAVYDVHRHDNEDESAQLAAQHLASAGLAPDLIDRVCSLIMATKTHHASDSRDTQILLDVDLSILGADRLRFVEYERQIREEYAYVPDGVFNEKRQEILRHFLDRPRIFITPEFFDRYEKRARANLTESLSSDPR
jgi:predicted metal-dependent HD superfamily phosphohydrolase